jgi:sterol 3beta-glucosyltransferase
MTGFFPVWMLSVTTGRFQSGFDRGSCSYRYRGAGTTGASLRAGRPTIIRPFFGDQAFWAERVDAMKVGKSLRHMSAHSLASALEYVTRDETVRKRAAALGEQIKKVRTAHCDLDLLD